MYIFKIKFSQSKRKKKLVYSFENRDIFQKIKIDLSLNTIIEKNKNELKML